MLAYLSSSHLFTLCRLCTQATAARCAFASTRRKRSSRATLLTLQGCAASVGPERLPSVCSSISVASPGAWAAVLPVRPRRPEDLKARDTRRFTRSNCGMVMQPAVSKRLSPARIVRQRDAKLSVSTRAVRRDVRAPTMNDMAHRAANISLLVVVGVIVNAAIATSEAEAHGLHNAHDGPTTWLPRRHFRRYKETRRAPEYEVRSTQRATSHLEMCGHPCTALARNMLARSTGGVCRRWRRQRRRRRALGK